MNEITSKSRSRSRSRSNFSHCKYRFLFVPLILLLTFVTSPAFAVDDDIPFFAGANGAPNIMFIFDNSDSMQDIPYLRADGRTVRPGTNPNSTNNKSNSNWMWRQGVQTGPDPADADNTIVLESDSGYVLYDYAAFPSDIENLIPQQTPSNLPGSSPTGLSGTAETTISTSTVPSQTLSTLPGKTSLTSDISALTDNDKIFDDTLDWSAADLNGDFDEFYLFRLVQVSSSAGDQYRTITGVSVAGEYFEIDTSLEAGGDLDYTTPPYTYTVLSDAPGRVTRGVGDLSILTDANIDWLGGSVNSDFINRGITVTSGTNAGEVRKISGYDLDSKTWTVSEDFPVACDETTRYMINQVDTNTGQVYDSSLNWTVSGAYLYDESKFNTNYLYRLIEVTSSTGTVQQRTISSRDLTNKYFQIDTSAAAGGPLVYSAAEVPYTYTILNNGPGIVTRYYNNRQRVRC